MKKLISTLIFISVLFNFIFCIEVKAESVNNDVDSNTVSGSDLESLINDSKIDYAGQTSSIDFSSIGKATFGTIGGILARLLNIFPYIIILLMTVSIDGQMFTIEKAVFNEIPFFNINYFDFNKEHSSVPGIALRESVAKFYYIFRLMAMAISLVVLIYVGIRMALSTVSQDKAKYKKMLISWFESVLLLFIMQYIMSLIFGIGNVFTDLITKMKDSLYGDGELSFETEINTIIGYGFGHFTGWSYAVYSIVFWFLVYIQTKFFLMYFKRTIAVGFLIVIAPLVTITYPIDKLGDGKAQAFSVWFNEFAMNVFIQPIHAVIYLIFMFTAGEIAKTSIWIALAFLLCLTKVEKIILKLFNLRNVGSLKPVDEQRKSKRK